MRGLSIREHMLMMFRCRFVGKTKSNKKQVNKQLINTVKEPFKESLEFEHLTIGIVTLYQNVGVLFF